MVSWDIFIWKSSFCFKRPVVKPVRFEHVSTWSHCCIHQMLWPSRVLCIFHMINLKRNISNLHSIWRREVGKIYCYSHESIWQFGVRNVPNFARLCPPYSWETAYDVSTSIWSQLREIKFVQFNEKHCDGPSVNCWIHVCIDFACLLRL